MWLTGRLAPDFKAIADFRRDNGSGMRGVCRRFVELCSDLKPFSQAAVAIDGSKFKAVNSRYRNFTPAKIKARKKQIEESIQRYLDALETAVRIWSMPMGRKTGLASFFRLARTIDRGHAPAIRCISTLRTARLPRRQLCREQPVVALWPAAASAA